MKKKDNPFPKKYSKATSSFRNGEIDSYQYTQSVESAYDIQLIYLDTLNAYNKTIIAINYLTL